MVAIGREIRITGRVQGVFFRAWTVEQARELDVTGWVRNCPDGTVEAHLSGDEAAVAELVARMRRGPPGAQVAKLTTDEARPEDGSGFEIRRD